LGFVAGQRDGGAVVRERMMRSTAGVVRPRSVIWQSSSVNHSVSRAKASVADADPPRGAVAVETDPVHVPAADQSVAVEGNSLGEQGLEACVPCWKHYVV
jgi:hypothetical protein